MKKENIYKRWSWSHQPDAQATAPDPDYPHSQRPTAQTHVGCTLPLRLPPHSPSTTTTTTMSSRYALFLKRAEKGWYDAEPQGYPSARRRQQRPQLPCLKLTWVFNRYTRGNEGGGPCMLELITPG